MMESSMEAVVFGNVTLDVLCYPVEDVPRYESITFKHSVVSPGGCGSNVAIGLSALGVATALVGRIGSDASFGLITHTWDRVAMFSETLNYKQVLVLVLLTNIINLVLFIHQERTSFFQWEI